MGIKYQILLIALIPALLFVVLFKYSHFTNNVEQAHNLLNRTIDTHKIIHASVYNENGKATSKLISAYIPPNIGRQISS